jgi:protein gp37
MADSSSIEWTDATWNPVTGCDRVSPGCANCYALELAPRLRAMGNPKYLRARDGGRSSGPAFGVTLHPTVLEQPLRWRKPRLVFVNSMSDLFHEEIPDEYIARVFAVMGDAHAHTFQVLTKRPERMRELLRSWRFCKLVMKASTSAWTAIAYHDDGYLPNVWLGVSIENRRFVGRADVLRETPAAVRFISAEPLLGPLVANAGGLVDGKWTFRFPDGRTGTPLSLAGIDWLIVGGESGPRHRPIREEWVRDLRDAAINTRTAFFFKQWGGRTPKAGGRLLDGQTWDEMPTPAVHPGSLVPTTQEG